MFLTRYSLGITTLRFARGVQSYLMTSSMHIRQCKVCVRIPQLAREYLEVTDKQDISISQELETVTRLLIFLFFYLASPYNTM